MKLLSMLSCVFDVACTQDNDINTSKREIALRSQTDVGVKPFNVWPKDKQKAAIKACGLATSKFTNKTARISILGYLASTDLPTDEDVVKSRIQELDINPSGANSPQQKAYLLLYYMTPKALRAGICDVYVYVYVLYISMRIYAHVCMGMGWGCACMRLCMYMRIRMCISTY